MMRGMCLNKEVNFYKLQKSAAHKARKRFLWMRQKWTFVEVTNMLAVRLGYTGFRPSAGWVVR